jgi:cytochrome c-type biogenesis protein CcmH
MLSFLIPAFILLAAVLFLLLRPYIFSAGKEGTSRRQMNAAIYRDELDKLAAEHAAGTINAVEYEMSHAEMRQRLFQDTHEEDDKAAMGSTKKVALGVCVFILLLSSGLYFYLGDAVRVAQRSEQKPVGQADVEKMVADFAQKMEKDPGNLKGWAMLARSYRILGRNEDAAKAYAHAGNFINDDPELLAEYADVLVGSANGSFAGKPLQLIHQALKLDPNNFLALWLSGTASFNEGNYKLAAQTWERLVKQLPPESNEARAIQGSIAEARSKGGLPTQSASANAGKTIGGTIELSPELKTKVKPGDIVMVIARQAGERMPVAVLKNAVTSFPMSFVLTDDLAMNPNNTISKFRELDIEVRISKSGMAKAEPGDLISNVKSVKVGSDRLRLLIDQVRQ